MINTLFTATIAKDKNITLLCHTSRMDEAAAIIRKQHPDIVLLDTNNAPFFGLDEVTLIRQFSPTTKTIAQVNRHLSFLIIFGLFKIERRLKLFSSIGTHFKG